MGNAAYRDAFPGVEFIAHVKTRDYLPTTGLNNRKQAMSEQGYLAVKRGETLEQTRASVHLDVFQKQFAGAFANEEIDLPQLRDGSGC